MGTLEMLQEAFARDQFAKAAGISITEVSDTCVLCEMPITKMHENARGKVMGGAIFTLADFCASVAANIDAVKDTTITLQASITYLSAAKGKKLIAKGRRIRKGRNTALHEVQITDDLGTEVARASVNGYILDIPPNTENNGNNA